MTNSNHNNSTVTSIVDKYFCSGLKTELKENCLGSHVLSNISGNGVGQGNEVPESCCSDGAQKSIPGCQQKLFSL